ncbi:MAG: diaminopimelate decarboxylase [Desulfobacterales bacterium]|nr:diaminopimelate decarboxylase [Desulfobacterales bacterium]
MNTPDSTHTHFWWERAGLEYREGLLFFEGKPIDALVKRFGTPTFAYSAPRIESNIERLKRALSQTCLDAKLFYAMKANRFAPILSQMAGRGLCGIDACSPEEVMLASSCGFPEEAISYTATAVSNQDLERLLPFKGLHINCDAISTLRRLGKRDPGRAIGLRINPAMGVGYGENELLHYSGDATTKFGIYEEQFDEALAVAADYHLTITTLHLHTGCGYLNTQLPVWEKILLQAKDFAKKIPSLTALNLGGGLGVPHTQNDLPLDLNRWAEVIQRVFGDTRLTLQVEPGDYIVKDAGLLLLTANTVETRQSTRFVGVNAGFNIAIEPAIYALPFEPVVACLRPGKKEPVTVCGNINEALDIFIKSHPLPPILEEDTIALINAGAYASSMSSNHCMRGTFREILIR